MSLDYVDPSNPPPVDWNGPVFPEPMLYRLAPLWLFLLVLAVLGLLFYRQRLMDARSDHRRAPSIIYREVRLAIDQALRATGPATIPAGQRVIETVKLYLDPMLKFSGDLRGCFGKLEKAVKGEAQKHEGGHHHPPVEHSQPAVVVSSSAEQRVLVTPAQIITATDAGHSGHGDHHESMSTHEQTAAVRYALERLHDFWTPNNVEPRLKEIRDALSIREPKGVGAQGVRARPSPAARPRARPPQAAKAKS